MIFEVDDNIIWGMSGTTSAAYCQQWTTIRGAVCAVSVMPFSISGSLGKSHRALLKGVL